MLEPLANPRWRPAWLGLLASALLLAPATFGQSAPAEGPTVPIDAENGFLQNQGAQPRFQSASKISPDTLAAVLQQRVASVPHFSGSFLAEGRTFPFTLVGAPPRAGGTTQIPTQIVAVSLLFEGFLDQDGEPIMLDPEPVLKHVQGSPNFRPYSYQTGLTQFADAVQRAQFFHSMSQDWHTLLAPPEMLHPVTIDVPAGMAKVYRNRLSGATYAVVDTRFFLSQLNTVVQLERLRPDALVLILTTNVFLAPQADVKQCCLLGFHTAFAAGSLGRLQQIQTLVWASWVDQGLFGSSVGDVTPMSHEISEWMNNPFGTNTVPAWQPVGASQGCQTNLETADPVATLPDAAVPVNIDGFTFHPQTEVLLPWFTHQGTQDTIDGAFSFPDENLVIEPARPCTAP
jgi:chitinase